jgi:hypothetical protein
MTSDFGEMADRVGDFRDELEEQHEQRTKDAMGEMRVSVRNRIAQNDSVARQQLVRDVRESPTGNGASLVERAVSVPEWAKYLEHGTGQRGKRDTQPDHESFSAPSPMPPLENIIEWIIAKNITPTEYDTTYGLASAIQETIGNVGTFAHPFLRPVWFNARTGYKHVVRENHRGLKIALRRL